MPTLQEVLVTIQPHLDQAVAYGEREKERKLRTVRRSLREALGFKPIVSYEETRKEDRNVTIPEDAFERAREACREIGIEL